LEYTPHAAAVKMEYANLKMKIELKATKRWGNSKPLASTKQPDGRTTHVLADGRKLTVGRPTHILYYQSSWVGSEACDTYEVPIALSGAHDSEGFYEAWNFDLQEVRNYAFKKTKKLVQIDNGTEISGDELMRALAPSG
jgi:hypothetical protein